MILMRRALRILVRVAVVLIVLIIAIIAVAYVMAGRRMNRIYQVSVPAITVPADQAAIDRGRRLAIAITPCGDCHGKDFGGQVMIENGAMGRLWASNLTRGRGGVASHYKGEDWARTFLHGVKPDGRTVVFMPSHNMHFTADDVGDMAAFFGSLPPVDREIPQTRIGPMAAVLSYVGMPLFPAELIDHEHVQFVTPVVATTPEALGHQLVAKGACQSCHKDDFTGGSGPPPGASNITPAGIGAYTETDFVRAIRQHVRPNGSKIEESMPRGYGQMTDEELHAMFVYLKTVPAKGEKTKRQM
jgi:cytochrome c553